MATAIHSYGRSCALREESNQFTRKASTVSDEPPKIKPQFFYRSNLPIDDPLSPLPPPSTSTSSSFPSRPFSTYDNTTLEEAWQDLKKEDDKSKVHKHGHWCHDADAESKDFEGQHLAKIVKDIGASGSTPVSIGKTDKGRASAKEKSKLSSVLPASDGDSPAVHPVVQDETAPVGLEHMPVSEEPSSVQGSPASASEVSNASLKDDTELGSSTPTADLALPVVAPKESQDQGNPHVLLCGDPQHVPFDDYVPITSDEIAEDELASFVPERRHRSIFHRRSSHNKEKAEKSSDKKPLRTSRSSSRQRLRALITPYGSSPSERQTTGTPFLRAPSPAHDGETPRHDGADSASESDGHNFDNKSPKFKRFHSNKSNMSILHSSSSPRVSPIGRNETKAYVPVGLSRLHLVEMPDLKMKPIYWSPIHDISSVVRGTWFYKETMLPVEPDVANRLEEGYEYMKPWTITYNDEVNSCLEIGQEAESKIVYELWPPEETQSFERRPGSGNKSLFSSKTNSEPLTPEEKARKHAAEMASSRANKAVGILDAGNSENGTIRRFPKSGVIYANARDAQILRPTLLPSPSYGRSPLNAIRKGRVIGVPVVRGFDQRAWDKLYPQKKSFTSRKAQAVAVTSQSRAAITMRERDTCPACLSAEERPKVTDLVLVIHGIGQKLSERIESYHFTHAINGFRRQLSVELQSDAVQPWLRPDLGGIMVLPVNWRSTLTFDNGRPVPATDSKRKEFTLQDIMPDTIPAVRNLISDVMLDIPYYLSHHKTKMIEAVVKEANRIYRLWCRNNPGFHESGRVHLIAHSLGSVMALDILSKQPTKLPKQLDLLGKKVGSKIFEFDTKNLFFCGSPAGFFLLLNRAPLVPRRARGKPGIEGEDLRTNITGESNTYGCLAVDNIYNIMHYNDPITNKINACVDVDYAASIQPAAVPSARSTWLQTLSSVFRSGTPATPLAATTGLDGLPRRPGVGKLPSTMEMETHNFSLEEMAEQKMYLLNDNGQIDYFLSSGGGPLEIQYLNMLSAHSSYWVLQDFVRFLVVEIGRKPGRPETIPGMRAVKKAWGKK
ncbi:hypothetical protein MMC13_003378 [Lambiella insularis]|nr:hypothetical protein [Lambiella insularis]